ncbi:MAG TPA: hypothetical protein VNO33_19570 [Kofleriaceae bacterium]|nr:hypothetical protein [Kofleriaceae bacterium]
MALLTGRAEARPRPSGGTPFSANKTFGFGIVLGEPIGLTAKYYLSDSTALDFAFGEYDRFRDDDDLGVHMDFLWHPLTLATADPFVIPLYFGIGGRVVGDDDDGPGDDDDVRVGVRVPVGVALDFNRVPLDIFFELAILIDFIADEDDDDVDLDPAVGVRYYF